MLQASKRLRLVGSTATTCLVVPEHDRHVSPSDTVLPQSLSSSQVPEPFPKLLTSLRVLGRKFGPNG